MKNVCGLFISGPRAFKDLKRTFTTINKRRILQITALPGRRKNTFHKLQACFPATGFTLQ